MCEAAAARAGRTPGGAWSWRERRRCPGLKAHGASSAAAVSVARARAVGWPCEVLARLQVGLLTIAGRPSSPWRSRRRAIWSCASLLVVTRTMAPSGSSRRRRCGSRRRSSAAPGRGCCSWAAPRSPRRCRPRSGSGAIDLRIAAGQVAARVSGSSLYDVAIEIDAVGRDAWHAIRRDCAGGIGSRIDLLAGKLSQPVMARLCADRTGLFPAPSAIRFRCSCPDIARMCKHVAAAMYGIGARLDARIHARVAPDSVECEERGAHLGQVASLSHTVARE